MQNVFHSFYQGDGAMSVEFSLPRQWQLDEVRLHLQAAGGAAENFLVAIDSGAGSRWDTSLDTTDMNSVADAQYLPTRQPHFREVDVLKLTYTNTNSKQWGLEIIYH